MTRSEQLGETPDALIERLRTDEVTVTVLPDGSGVMLDMAGHQVLSLTPTGVVLVDQMRLGAQRIDELALSLVDRFDVAFNEAHRDTIEFVDALSEALSGSGSQIAPGL